jgi:hypothetical protein
MRCYISNTSSNTVAETKCVRRLIDAVLDRIDWGTNIGTGTFGCFTVVTAGTQYLTLHVLDNRLLDQNSLN